MCNFWEVGCHAREWVRETTNNIIAQWAQDALESASSTMIELGALWTEVETPGMSGSDSAVSFVRSSTSILVIAMAIGSLFVAGIYLAFSRKGDGALKILQGFLTLALVSSVSVGAAQLLVEASDEFSSWIVSLAADGDSGEFVEKFLQIGDLNAVVGWLVIIIGGVMALIANIVQIGLMFIRSGMLILLVGILPIAGAAYFTKWGASWLWKMVGWFFAFLLFKPAASIIYAVGIKLMSADTYLLSNAGEVTTFLVGVMMLILGVLALPGLITFMVPATEALSNGSGGAGAGVGAVMATGAMTVARGAGAASTGGATEVAGAAASAGQSAQGAATSTVAGGSGASGVASGSSGAASSGGAQSGQGSAGATGADGSAGTLGGPGPSGADGDAGAPGDMGADGPSGATGEPGDPGMSSPSGSGNAIEDGGPTGGGEAVQ